MAAAFFDFFRKIILKSEDGSTIETVIEADSFTDELTIVRGPGVAFNGDDTTDTFEINVDYDITVPIGGTNLTLTDINGNTSSVSLVAGNNIILTRNSDSELRIDAADITTSITNVILTNPIQITTAVAHGLVNGAEITIQDVVGTTELNGNTYFADVIDSNNFFLYAEEALLTAIDGTSGFSAYVSNGSVQVENTATLESLLDVNLGTPALNELVAYNGSIWTNVDSVTLTTVTADIVTDSITASTSLDINSVAGNTLTVGNGGSTALVVDHDADTISLNAGSNVLLGDTSGDILVGDGTNTMSFVSGTTVDFANTTISNATVNGSLTGNADTATELQTPRNIGGVSFNGTADINLPGVNTAGTQDTSGNAATATALETTRTFEITGGGITAVAQNFDGTGNVILNASVDNDSIALGTKTTGNYVATIQGTSGQISVTGSGSETAAVTLAFPNNVVIPNDLSVNGDLNVYGSTTSIETTNTVISDNIILLNDGATNNTSDSGIIIERGAAGDNAILAWDESEDKWILGTTTANAVSTGNLAITPATVVAASFEGAFGGVFAGTLRGELVGSVFAEDSGLLVDAVRNEFKGNADTASAWQTARTITLGDDLTGSVTIDGSSNVTLNASVANDSHNHTAAFITDFTSAVNDQIETLLTNGSQNNGVSVVINKANDELNFNLSTPTLNLVNASGVGVTGSATIDLSAGTISLETELSGEVPLGTNTSGNYVQSLVAGTGINLANNSGESATPTINVANLPNSALTNSSITLTDNTNTETVDLGETLTVQKTDQIEVTVGATNLLTIGHAASGVTAASYGGTGNLVSITVDAEGHITSLADAALPSPTITFTGDINGVATLTNLGGTTSTITLTANLNDVVDVQAPTPGDGEILVYNGSSLKWENRGVIKADIVGGSVFGIDSTILVDAMNSSLPYTPATPSDWNGTAPTTVAEALDRLAAWITTNGGAGSP